MEEEDDDPYLSAVMAEPESDALRLAFAEAEAEWDRERAEFVRLQVARVRAHRLTTLGEEVDIASPPSERETALVRRRGREWGEALALLVSPAWHGRPNWTFHRGLLAHIEISPALFLESPRYVLNQRPIRHIDFRPVDAHSLASLLQRPELGELDSIGFSQAGLDDAAVVQLAECEHLRDLLYLDLSFNVLSQVAFDAIAASPHLRNLVQVRRTQHISYGPEMTFFPGEHAGNAMALPEAGQALVARHGPLLWLFRRNRISRFDVRWAVTAGLRPVES